MSDPIEDRVRRTFATRADDMAPGDGAAGDPGLHELLARPPADGPASREDRRPGRFLLAAAIVVIVGVALAAIGVVVANDGGRNGAADPAGGGGDEAHVEVVDLVTAPQDLVIALQDERNLASVELIGQSDLIDLPVDDPAEARRRTDEAVAALTALVANDPAASAYQGPLDRLVGLAEVRRDIDAYAGPRDMRTLETANEVFARYAQLVGWVLDAQDETALAIDDPDLRTGARAYASGLRQQELTAQLVRAALTGTIEPGSSTVTELSRLYHLVRDGQDALRSLAAGTPYEEATTAALDEVEDSGLLDLVAAALEGPADIAGLLAAVELPVDEGWPAFLDRVEQILVAED